MLASIACKRDQLAEAPRQKTCCHWKNPALCNPTVFNAHCSTDSYWLSRTMLGANFGLQLAYAFQLHPAGAQDAVVAKSGADSRPEV